MQPSVWELGHYHLYFHCYCAFRWPCLSQLFLSQGFAARNISSYSVILFTSLISFQTTVSFYYTSKYTNKTIYLLRAGTWLKINIPLNELESGTEPRNLSFSLQVNLCTLNFEKHFSKIQIILIFSREENGRKKIKSLQKQLLNVKKERQAEVQVRIIWTMPSYWADNS